MSESSKHSISRRNALRGAAMVTAASLAAPGIASAASGLMGSNGLRTFRGRYALPGGRVIEGYFVAPRGKAALDTIVVFHGDQGIDARAEAVANYYAASGKIAIVPDMSRGANRDELQRLKPNFGKRSIANGNVEYVAA